jgi:hypothetical protein
VRAVLERRAKLQEIRHEERDEHLAMATLACPSCDAPVHPGPEPLGPADPLACPLCDRAGAVRDFLSLASPTRPARVEVRVVLRG